MFDTKEILKDIYFEAINNSFSKKDIKRYLEDGIYIFTVGKAANTMAKVCENELEDKIKGGLAISNKTEKLK